MSSSEELAGYILAVTAIRGIPDQLFLGHHIARLQGGDSMRCRRAAGVDTIPVTGVTASACVRETICDGLADGFRPIAIKEAIGDRVAGAVLWNLFDIDAKGVQAKAA